MADTKLSGLAALTGVNAAGGDLLGVVDISDTSMAASGTNKSMTLLELEEYLEIRALPRVKRLNSTHSISSATGTEVTDLTMPLDAGTHVVDYYLIVRSATTSVSPLLGINFTGTAAVKSFIMLFADASSSLLAELHTMSNEGSNAFGFISGRATKTYTTTSPNLGSTATLAVAATATDTPVRITGLLIVTVGGNLALWHSSETATATSVEVGSSVVAVRTA